MTNDTILIQLISTSPFLNQGDKSFLIEKVSQMTPLDKLKLRQSLMSGQAPGVLQQLQMMRAKFFQQETPRQPDPITQVLSNILPAKPKRVLSASVLMQPQYLGGPAPQAVRGDNFPALNSLQDFSHPAQLSLLNSSHITFNINDNVEQIIQNFLQKTAKTFDKIDNINLKRSYFMNFLESKLFTSYLNTGMTALRHPELEPAKIILNLLYQIDSNYLNNKQFQHAATITNHLRALVAL